MSKNIKTVISDQLSVISKTLKRKEKKTAKIILLAIIFLLATEAQRHKVFFKSPKLIDISAPGSAAICSAAESYFQQGSNSVISYQQKKLKASQCPPKPMGTRAPIPPLDGFSLTPSGNFLASHPFDRLRAGSGTKAQRILDADIRRGNYEA